MRSCFVRLALPLLFGALTTANGQLVTPKTVPVHQDNQFEIFPSLRRGMAGVSIALDDTLADPFSNPAKATRVRTGTVFMSPYVHGITAGSGGGQTLPVGGFATSGNWAGAADFAVQELNHGAGFGSGNAISDRTASNQYGTVVVARRLADGLSIGGSAYVAGLNAVDGVDLLFAGSDRLVQSGTLTDIRLGVTKEWSDRRLEFVLVNNRTNMTEDAHYTTYFYPPIVPGPPYPQSYTTERTDHNIDQTTIWGAHTQYAQALSDGWRVGWLATANRLSHPHIPNYQIQNIPRDPGTTYGFNVGAGAARIVGGTSFGIDVIAEPMYSNTWGTAAHDTAIVGGGVIRAGDKLIANRFTFSNAKIRAGFEQDVVIGPDSTHVLGLQMGLGVYSINYRLRQTNNALLTERVQDEGWTEWTPTLGLQWRTKDFAVQYTYSRTCGPSDCVDVQGNTRFVVAPGVPTTGGVIAAPSSPLTIDGGTAHVHRIMVSVPIR